MKTRNFVRYYNRSNEMKILTFAYTYFVGVALLLAMAVFAPLAYSQPAPDCTWNDCSGTQVGPGPCTHGWVCPLIPPPSAPPIARPLELCLGAAGCVPVSYRLDGAFVIAESALPNGYPVMGFAGPFFGSVEESPGIWENAFQRLVVEARAANRAQRFE
jgi:hypothetical protein